ncbi:hypothetical protein PCASD_21169 [Puccinia coronata f. sp. avenae]|uniref:Uncharacterized protein n=1 Tax=Puccinia coronata f. sp. avenae TaxID=200324 RepID=A0A2N5TQ84_9BASI|nr:hypothetical protein PCASD_21169 [Puccinia coronata f. sp. avenae]
MEHSNCKDSNAHAEGCDDGEQAKDDFPFVGCVPAAWAEVCRDVYTPHTVGVAQW